MFKKLDFIALIPNSYTEIETYTLYFHEKTENYILPIKITKHEVSNLIEGKKTEIEPSIFNTMNRLVVCLGATISSITIYKYKDNIYYTYLNILHLGINYELNIKLLDGLSLAKKLKLPIFISYETLCDCGIKITKKLLKEAMSCDYNLS